LRKLWCFVLATAAASAAGCGHGTATAPTGGERAPKTIRLGPGHYTFHLGGRVRVGDSISCVTRKGAPAGGGGVQPRGHSVFSSMGFRSSTSRRGVVRVTCPVRPIPV
jgi:hypothetical protein